MLSFIVVFALVSFSSIYTLPQPRQSIGVTDLSLLVSTADCSFYTTLNTIYQCGPKSHLMQYSYKYCQRLLDTRDSFENVQYQDNARQCLQQNLLNKVQQPAQATITCDEFKQMDLDSHGSCLAAAFRELSASDIIQFITTFKDTTVNYAELCRLANNFAGYWSQVVNDDLMSFVKRQLNVVFPEGDTSSCTIKESEIIEEIVEVVADIEKVLDEVKGIEDDIVLIVEKAKAIRDDFNTIRDTIKGMQDGSISTLDGTKIILEKTETIMANSKIIIDTITNLGKNKTNTPTGGLENTNVTRILEDMIEIIDQLEALKGEVFNVLDNVITIVGVIDDIRDGKINITDGLQAISGQLEQGVGNIYSIITTSLTLKNTAVDLVDTIVKDVEGAVDNVVDTAGQAVDQVVGGATGVIGGATDTVSGAIGSIGGIFGGFGKK